ncbi:MAG: 50S ribosomal protein L9 [bacterium]
MKVVLLKDVKKVGIKYEEKEVSDGYAVNHLIPKGFAVPASSPVAKQVLAQKETSQASREKELKDIETNLTRLSKTPIKFTAKANEQGHLFEKLNAHKLSTIVEKETGQKLDSSYFELETPIKEIGTHKVPIAIGDFHVELTLEVRHS